MQKSLKFSGILLLMFALMVTQTISAKGSTSIEPDQQMVYQTSGESNATRSMSNAYWKWMVVSVNASQTVLHGYGGSDLDLLTDQGTYTFPLCNTYAEWSVLGILPVIDEGTQVGDWTAEIEADMGSTYPDINAISIAGNYGFQINYTSNTTHHGIQIVYSTTGILLLEEQFDYDAGTYSHLKIELMPNESTVPGADENPADPSDPADDSGDDDEEDEGMFANLPGYPVMFLGMVTAVAMVILIKRKQ